MRQGAERQFPNEAVADIVFPIRPGAAPQPPVQRVTNKRHRLVEIEIHASAS